MLAILLCGVSASAITASLGAVPLVWTVLNDVVFDNNSGSVATNLTYVYSLNTPTHIPSFTNIRLTFTAHASNPFNILKCYVGRLSVDRADYMFQEAATPVTFNGGSVSVNIPATQSKVSDNIPFVFNGGAKLVIALVMAAGNTARRLLNTGTGWSLYQAAGDLLPDPASSSFLVSSGLSLCGLDNIEVTYDYFGNDNQIHTSSTTMSVVKEGAVPQDNKIRAVKQVFAVVKEGSSPSKDNTIKTINQSFYVVKG